MLCPWPGSYESLVSGLLRKLLLNSVEKECQASNTGRVRLSRHYSDNQGKKWIDLDQFDSHGLRKKWVDLGDVLEILNRMCLMIVILEKGERYQDNA